jgi:hypothetical protein
MSTSETYNDTTNEGGFSDVFKLAQCYSTLLDDILSVCLLHSSQQGVGDLLHHSLELVLEFSIVIRELHREHIQEYIISGGTAYLGAIQEVLFEDDDIGMYSEPI